MSVGTARLNQIVAILGLYTHVCKPETLRAAYELAKQNDLSLCRPIGALTRLRMCANVG